MAGYSIAEAEQREQIAANSTCPLIAALALFWASQHRLAQTIIGWSS